MWQKMTEFISTQSSWQRSYSRRATTNFSSTRWAIFKMYCTTYQPVFKFETVNCRVYTGSAKDCSNVLYLFHIILFNIINDIRCTYQTVRRRFCNERIPICYEGSNIHFIKIYRTLFVYYYLLMHNLEIFTFQARLQVKKPLPNYRR